MKRKRSSYPEQQTSSQWELIWHKVHFPENVLEQDGNNQLRRSIHTEMQLIVQLWSTWSYKWTVSLNQWCSTLSDSSTSWSDLHVNTGWSTLQFLHTLQKLSILCHLFMLMSFSQKDVPVRWNPLLVSCADFCDQFWYVPYSALPLDIRTQKQVQIHWKVFEEL